MSDSLRENRLRRKDTSRRTALAYLLGAAGSLMAADVLAQPAGRQPAPGMGPRTPPPGAQPPGAGQGPRAPTEEPPADAKAGVPIIDVHAHLFVRGAPYRAADFAAAAAAAVAWMDKVGIRRMLVMSPPNHEAGRGYERDMIIEGTRAHPGRFAFLDGGSTLNPMIHGAAHAGSVTQAVERNFVREAERGLAAGAVGFGEMSAEHLSYFVPHPYNSAPPDHKLFLLLADIAAERGVPVDLHMEAVPSDMPTPPPFQQLSPLNPPTLKANIEAFRRLLAHNRRARIIWNHVGVDATRQRSVRLCRELLRDNENLAMSIATPAAPKFIMDAGDRLRPEWLALFSDFSDRFMLGTDSFHMPPGMNVAMPRSWKVRLVVNQLPDDAARKVGHLNAQRMFNLPPI
ncbi:MAG: amidohydrolase family protein [Proteobacteria bacterium]|nr:amidohydrolase family protein [Pseudomonadota bacterium]